MFWDEQDFVSILTRAFARVQRRPRARARPAFAGFNPHSSFRPSATQWGWARAITWKFQSSLELSPECNHHPPCGPEQDYRFNPHSSFRPSATQRPGLPCGGWACFNPHSSFRPSATFAALSGLPKAPVSILTRAFARVQPAGRGAWHTPKLFQSSLELSPECNGLILACVLDGVQ